MTTAFGPQSPNYSLARPPVDPEVSGGTDTWVVDCSAAGVRDGTILTASFFNSIVGNLRTAVRTAGVDLDATDDEMLLKAIRQIAETSIANNIGADGGLNWDGATRTMTVTIGDGSRNTLAAAAIDPALDKVWLYDETAGAQEEATPYALVKSVLSDATGVDDAGGKLTFHAPKHFSQSSAPVATGLNDTWFDPDDGTIYVWTTDGNSTFWLDIR